MVRQDAILGGLSIGQIELRIKHIFAALKKNHNLKT